MGFSQVPSCPTRLLFADPEIKETTAQFQPLLRPGLFEKGLSILQALGRNPRFAAYGGQPRMKSGTLEISSPSRNGHTRGIISQQTHSEAQEQRHA
jgi:hypothetical protein